MSEDEQVAGRVDTSNEIGHVIRRSCYLLDQEKFSEWLDLFRPGGTYEVAAVSPEIQKSMCWMRGTREELQELFAALPNHVREDATRAHMVMEIDVDVADASASCLSRFVVFKTNQRGETTVYAVGHYEDELLRVSGAWKFARRKVMLDTRMFDIFPHMIPL
jgi:3-phenylpropionate/cinnamic acid dioxygenase small subunit